MDRKFILSHLDYDPDTGIFTWKFNDKKPPQWNGKWGGKAAGSVSETTGYINININKKMTRAHRLAWIVAYGSEPANQIDHINGNRTDNRINNLRCVSNMENGKNQKLRSTNTSGLMGVGIHRGTGKYRSRIYHNNKEISLGLFDSFFEACCARKSAEKRYGYHENHGRPYNPS